MILVTGGTGLVGSHLLYLLIRDNLQVRAIHRASSDLEKVRKVFSYYTDQADMLFDKIQWFEATLNDLPSLEKAFEGITHVYHSAAYISFHPKHFRKMRKINLEGTANIVNLCLEWKIKKLCYVSSIATLGHSLNGELIDEETDWNPEDDNNVYAISKYGAEMEVWRGIQEGLEAVIVNPGVILGEGHWRSASGSIVKTVARGVPFYTPGGVGVVDVRDVARAMKLLMESEITAEKYVLVGENMSYKDLLVRLSEQLGTNPPKKDIALWKMKILRFLDWLSSVLFNTRRKLLKSSVKSLYRESYYDASKIGQHLEFEFTEMEESIDRIARFYSKES